MKVQRLVAPIKLERATEPACNKAIRRETKKKRQTFGSVVLIAGRISESNDSGTRPAASCLSEATYARDLAGPPRTWILIFM